MRAAALSLSVPDIDGGTEWAASDNPQRMDDRATRSEASRSDADPAIRNRIAAEERDGRRGARGGGVGAGGAWRGRTVPRDAAKREARSLPLVAARSSAEGVPSSPMMTSSCGREGGERERVE